MNAGSSFFLECVSLSQLYLSFTLIFDITRKNTTKRIKEPGKIQQRETPSICCNLQQKQPRTIHRNNEKSRT